MAWRKVRGLKGRVYVPAISPAQRKHPCADCFACQNCSDERCVVCRKSAGNPCRSNKDDVSRRR